MSLRRTSQADEEQRFWKDDGKYQDSQGYEVSDKR